MTKLTLYKGDRRPSIKATLKYTDGTTVNLTDCTVKFQLVEVKTNVTILNETASIKAPSTTGVVQYDWKSGETDVDKSKYKARFAVTFEDGRIQTFPRKDDLYITFKKKENV